MTVGRVCKILLRRMLLCTLRLPRTLVRKIGAQMNPKRAPRDPDSNGLPTTAANCELGMSVAYAVPDLRAG